MSLWTLLLSLTLKHFHLSWMQCVREVFVCYSSEGKKRRNPAFKQTEKNCLKGSDDPVFLIWCLWTHNPEFHQILLKTNSISSVRTGSPLSSFVVASQAAPPPLWPEWGLVGRRGRRCWHSFHFTSACRRNLVILWLPKLFSTWVFYFLVPEGCWHIGQPSLLIILTWNGKSVCGYFHSKWFTPVLLSVSALYSLFEHVFISRLCGLLFFFWDFSVHFSFPCSLPIPHPPSPAKSLGPSLSRSPGPCPTPFVHILLPAWLPFSLLHSLLQALLVLPPLLFSSLGSLFMYPWAQSVIAHGTAGRQTELVHGHIIDRLSAKFLGRFVFKAVNAYTSLCFQFPGSHAKAWAEA